MLKEKVILKDYSNYKIGGPAKYFLDVKNIDDLKNGIVEWKTLDSSGKYFILGAGMNVLFSDEGYDGLIIHDKIDYIKNDGDIEVGSGTLVSDFLNYCIENSLSGLEWAGGLPGTIGGAVFGNAGAFSGETKDNVVSVKSLDMETMQEIERSNSECQFSYRSSIFKKTGGEFIVSITFKLTPGDKIQIEKAVDEKITYRKERQPLEFPSAGSTFKNVDLNKVPEELQRKWQDKVKIDPFPVIPVAFVLSEAGLKGKQNGGAQISEKHPNFFINKENAKASDVVELIKYAQSIVKQKFNIELEPEIIIVK